MRSKHLGRTGHSIVGCPQKDPGVAFIRSSDLGCKEEGSRNPRVVLTSIILLILLFLPLHGIAGTDWFMLIIIRFYPAGILRCLKGFWDISMEFV